MNSDTDVTYSPDRAVGTVGAALVTCALGCLLLAYGLWAHPGPAPADDASFDPLPTSCSWDSDDQC